MTYKSTNPYMNNILWHRMAFLPSEHHTHTVSQVTSSHVSGTKPRKPSPSTSTASAKVCLHAKPYIDVNANEYGSIMDVDVDVNTYGMIHLRTITTRVPLWHACCAVVMLCSIDVWYCIHHVTCCRCGMDGSHGHWSGACIRLVLCSLCDVY